MPLRNATGVTTAARMSAMAMSGPRRVPEDICAMMNRHEASTQHGEGERLSATGSDHDAPAQGEAAVRRKSLGCSHGAG